MVDLCFEYFVCRYYISDSVTSNQEDVNVYRSSPLLPGIPRPFHLLPSTHLQLEPDPEDSPDIEDTSDNGFGRAEAGRSTGEEENKERSPSPNDSVRANHPKGPCSVAQKRRASSQPVDTT